MLILFVVLVIIAAVILGLIVLIQNPKGGGLSASLGGFSNQLMGVKQTTDVLEKGTWVFAAIVGVLCMISVAFMPKGSTTTSSPNDPLKEGLGKGATQQKAAPAKPQTPATNTATPVMPDSPKK